MSKYVCAICGYIYDDDKEKVKFKELPPNWKCPLCGASKSEFHEQNATQAAAPKQAVAKESKRVRGDKELTNAELNVMCTNLAKGCEKQYKAEAFALFTEIADYYKAHSEVATKADFKSVAKILNDDLQNNFPASFDVAKADADRGALRVLTWSEKVSKIVSSLLTRYAEEGTEFLKNTKVFVCEICGFIYLGDEAPEICPVCKVPRFKIHEVGRI